MNIRELIDDLQQWPDHYEVFAQGMNCSSPDTLGETRRARLREYGKRAKPCVIIAAGWGPGQDSRSEEVADND